MTEHTGYSSHLQHWLDWMEGPHDREGLAAQLHPDVVFFSPIVHTPQAGRATTLAYLGAAGETLGGEAFKYSHIFDCGTRAVLEFDTLMDGIEVNGVDIIEWNGEGLITEFKVMVRPLKAIQTVHGAMKAMLEEMKAHPAPG